MRGCGRAALFLCQTVNSILFVYGLYNTLILSSKWFEKCKKEITLLNAKITKLTD